VRLQYEPTAGERLQSLPFVELHLIAALTRLLLPSRSSECSVGQILGEFDKLTGMIRKQVRNCSVSATVLFACQAIHLGGLQELNNAAIFVALNSLSEQGWIILSNRGGHRALAMMNSANVGASTGSGNASGMSPELITTNTVVVLIPPASTVQDCYRLRTSSGAAPVSLSEVSTNKRASQSLASIAKHQDPSYPTAIRPNVSIAVSERVRRAVLEPSEPVAVLAVRAPSHVFSR
jgi:hypothetical protein